MPTWNNTHDLDSPLLLGIPTPCIDAGREETSGSSGQFVLSSLLYPISCGQVAELADALALEANG